MARAGGMTNAVNVGIAVQADWENREFISNISLNVRRLFDFLLQFGPYSSSPSRFGLIRTDRMLQIFCPSFICLCMCFGTQIRPCFPEATTKSKLAALNEKLDILERKLEVLEVQVSSATTNPSVFT
ncbi:hypothetical protein ZIOFF_011335 [Zingiber officinale]|uniref:Protein BRICK 1 n=1 Tax=Zingiber officinale TaxID=94328 RepID=A0A8J5HQ95_ZINOF|nr:hypothetical protein ZIOFF_011335 [Zingiber officinale]